MQTYQGVSAIATHQECVSRVMGHLFQYGETTSKVTCIIRDNCIGPASVCDSQGDVIVHVPTPSQFQPNLKFSMCYILLQLYEGNSHST